MVLIIQRNWSSYGKIFTEPLEKFSSKQSNCDGFIEFLLIWQSFDLTPTFATIDETKCKKWTRCSKEFARNVIVEELRNETQKNITLKKQIRAVRQNCSDFRYLCVMKTMALLRKKTYQKKWQKTTHQKLHGCCTGILMLMATSRTFLRSISLSSTSSYYFEA